MDSPCRYGIVDFLSSSLLKVFPLIILCGFSQILLGQSSLSIQEWFEQRKAQWTSGITKEEFTDYRPSWIRELELRTETDEFILDRQEYLIRFRPTMPRERNAQKDLIEVSRKELELEKLDFERKLNRVILDEFLLIWKTKAQLSIKEELLVLLEDQKKIIEGKLEEKKFNLKDLSKAEQEIRDLQEDVFVDKLNIEKWSSKSDLPEVEKMVSPQELMNRLNSGYITGSDPFEVASMQFEKDKINAEIELEKAEESRIFDFFQIRYDGPHSDILRERISMGISLQLPYSSSKRLRQEELLLEQILNDQTFEYEKRLDSIELVMDLKKIDGLLKQGNFKEDQIKKQSEEIQLLIQYGLDEEYNSPELILFKKEQLVKSRLKLLDTYNDLYNQIFDLLSDYLLLDQPSLSTIISQK